MIHATFIILVAIQFVIYVKAQNWFINHRHYNKFMGNVLGSVMILAFTLFVIGIYKMFFEVVS